MIRVVALINWAFFIFTWKDILFIYNKENTKIIIQTYENKATKNITTTI